MTAAADAGSLIESRYAWLRLAASLAFMTLSSCGMYAIVVVLPAVQSEFAVDRAGASLPYTLTMIGFGLGGVVMGRVADRFGVLVPLAIGSVTLGLGFIAAAHAPGLLSLSIIQGVLIGFLGRGPHCSIQAGHTSRTNFAVSRKVRRASSSIFQYAR